MEKEIYKRLREFKKKYPNTLILVKEGIFYSSYRDDANIIWNIFGYKHLGNKVSFGQFPYDKVVNFLREDKISFCIVDKEGEYYRFDGNDDVYINYLALANIEYDKKMKEEMLLIQKLAHVISVDGEEMILPGLEDSDFDNNIFQE